MAGGDERGLLNRHLFKQLPLHRADFADDFMAVLQRRQHVVFRHLAGKAFDHQDRLLRARDDQVHVALLKVILRGKGNPLTVHTPHADRGDRTVKGQR